MASVLTPINEGTMPRAYFMIHWKGPGSLESSRTKFDSKLWYLAIWLWANSSISLVATGRHQAPCCRVKGGHEHTGPHLAPFNAEVIPPWKHPLSPDLLQSGWDKIHTKILDRQGIINWELFEAYNKSPLLYRPFVFMFGGCLNKCIYI